MYKLLSSLLFLCFFSTTAQEQFIKVGLLHGNNVLLCQVSVIRGNYELYINGLKKTELTTGKTIKFTYGKQISAAVENQIFSGKTVELRGISYVNQFALSSSYAKNVGYEDHLIVQQGKSSLQLINRVQLENYVAAVVEGEAGYAMPKEFYKLQAILSRTYVLKNINRHQGEGFHVCDKVHCQVYHHRNTKNQIFSSTYSTNGLVVVDNNLQLINTIFHSNCGGQTCNSEDVWNQPLSYLRCVQDTFCTKASKAYWTKSFSKTKVNSYFKLRENEPHRTAQLFEFCQEGHRLAHQNLLSVPLPKIRTDLHLRSTYFYLEDAGDSIRFIGRGYGHGVGLCQQGGIEMAKEGFSYVDILKHYYHGIHIVNRRAIRFFLN